MQETNELISPKRKKELVNAYILSCIDGSGYERVLDTDVDKVNFVVETFESEYKRNNNNTRLNDVALFAEWLMGLPSSFNIDYENYRILEIATEWQDINADSTERRKDMILANWWNYIANKFFQLHRHLNIHAKRAASNKK